MNDEKSLKDRDLQSVARRAFIEGWKQGAEFVKSMAAIAMDTPSAGVVDEYMVRARLPLGTVGTAAPAKPRRLTQKQRRIIRVAYDTAVDCHEDDDVNVGTSVDARCIQQAIQRCQTGNIGTSYTCDVDPDAQHLVVPDVTVAEVESVLRSTEEPRDMHLLLLAEVGAFNSKTGLAREFRMSPRTLNALLKKKRVTFRPASSM